MKITDTIKTLRLHNDWRRNPEGEHLNPRLIGQAIDAAIAQLHEHKTALLKIDQLTQQLAQAKGRKAKIRAAVIGECARAIGMSEKALVALMNKGE